MTIKENKLSRSQFKNYVTIKLKVPENMFEKIYQQMYNSSRDYTNQIFINCHVVYYKPIKGKLKWDLLDSNQYRILKEKYLVEILFEEKIYFTTNNNKIRKQDFKKHYQNIIQDKANLHNSIRSNIQSSGNMVSLYNQYLFTESIDALIKTIPMKNKKQYKENG